MSLEDDPSCRTCLFCVVFKDCLLTFIYVFRRANSGYQEISLTELRYGTHNNGYELQLVSTVDLRLGLVYSVIQRVSHKPCPISCYNLYMSKSGKEYRVRNSQSVGYMQDIRDFTDGISSKLRKSCNMRK